MGTRSERVRTLLLLVLLAVVGGIAWANWGEIVRAVRLLGQVQLFWLLPAVAAIGGVYLCRSLVYDLTLRMMGHSLDRRFLWSTAMIATSLHQLVAIAGASGYAFLAYAFHLRGVPGGRASLVALIDTLSNVVSVATLVLIGLLYLALQGELGIQRVLGLAGAGAVLVPAGVFLFRLQSDQPRFVRFVLRVKNRLARWLGRDWSDETVCRFLDQYYEGKAVIRARRRVFCILVGLQYVAVICDCVALYAVFLSLGVLPPLWVVFMGFVLAMAGLQIVTLPGGGGSFEVILTAFFARNGIPTAVGIAVALLYRLAAFWLPVVASTVVLAAWRREQRSRQRDLVEEK